MEFYNVHFSYIDQETPEERFVSVPEQGGGALIAESPLNPGVLHTVADGSDGHLGLYRLETQVTTGNEVLKLCPAWAAITPPEKLSKSVSTISTDIAHPLTTF